MRSQRAAFRWTLAALALLAGCSLRSVAVRQTAAIIENGAGAITREEDPELAREALPGQLKLLETFLESSPRDPRLLKALAQGFAGYAQLFLEDEQPDRAAGLYRRALGYALRSAALRPVLRGLGSSDARSTETALKNARAQDAPSLYWAAVSWAGWAQTAKNDPQALLDLPKAARLMTRVLELDPAYEHGGPDLWFGAYYCARPKLAGGDLEKGRAHFEASLRRSEGRYLTAKLLYAQHYAVAASDKELFLRLLREVRDGSPLPQARLADEIARRKAARLLAKADELF